MKTIQTILDEFDKEFFIVPDNVPKKEMRDFLRQVLTHQFDELKEKIEGVRVESARKTSSKNADEYRAYCTGGEEMQNRILTLIDSMK